MFDDLPAQMLRHDGVQLFEGWGVEAMRVHGGSVLSGQWQVATADCCNFVNLYTNMLICNLTLSGIQNSL